MYALVDCNSFFCSVEQAFRPDLQGKAVCVLSSNDGCIVALTPEAKAVGLHRGDPYFKVKNIVAKNNVAIFSSNLKKYSAVSKEINAILRDHIMDVDTYSIDECFCDLKGYEQHGNLEDFMRSIVEEIREKTDIPVSVGIAPSKTLAKMGSKFAKQYKGYRSVCVIDSDEKRRKALALFDLADVWGIGRKTFLKLSTYEIKTTLEFAEKSESWVRSRFHKPVIQTWLELNGRPCIDTREHKRNQTISMSRSFGEMQGNFDGLRTAVSTFASCCAETLRCQGSVAKVITVFLSTNPYRDDLEQYHNMSSMSLPVASSDSLEIVKTAVLVLQKIFRKGFLYKKAGVILSDISDSSCIELNLFDTNKKRPERQKLMAAMDALNAKAGKNVVKICSVGGENESWKSKSEFK